MSHFYPILFSPLFTACHRFGSGASDVTAEQGATSLGPGCCRYAERNPSRLGEQTKCYQKCVPVCVCVCGWAHVLSDKAIQHVGRFGYGLIIMCVCVCVILLYGSVRMNKGIAMEWNWEFSFARPCQPLQETNRPKLEAASYLVEVFSRGTSAGKGVQSTI